MSAATATLRLVRDTDAASASDDKPQPPDRGLLEQLQSARSEIDSLRAELEVHRRRDLVLNGQMQRLDEEMRLAARLQQDFLPKSLPRVGNLKFSTLFRPAGYVSGDLYDVMRLDEEHVGFYIADAVGHGMPAALLTMFLKRALVTKQITQDGYRLLRPSETMARLNDALVEQNLSQATFATALYGMINARTLEMQFARGGHPGPVILKRDGTLESLEVEGSLLGIFANETFPDASAMLELGDRAFIFSDGVEVSFSDPASADAKHWRQALQNRFQMPTEQLLDDLSTQIDAESGSLDPKDDLTVIVAETI